MIYALDRELRHAGYDQREYRDDPIPMTPKEMSSGKETLIKIQMSLLPSVKQLLKDLLTSVSLDDNAPKNSSPQFDYALEIVSQLIPTMLCIKSAIVSLAPWELRCHEFPIGNGINANDGALM
jgi:hypothetical protein